MSEYSQENPMLKLGPNPNGQVLYFFGARHTNDSKDEQFAYIQNFFEEFLSVAKGTKIMFVEGVTRKIPQEYNEAINQYGESGAVQWLAREVNINVIRPEPSDDEQRGLLCASFNHQIVAYSIIIQNLTGWFRHISQISFNEAIIRVLNREAKFSNIYGFVPDKLWFDDQHKKLFGEQRLEDKNFLDSVSDPRRGDTLVNSIIAFRTKIRNQYLLSAINEAWKSGKSIFIVYGSGHLVALKPELQKLI